QPDRPWGLGRGHRLFTHCPAAPRSPALQRRMTARPMPPLRRLSGVLLPLFSLRSNADYGVGDFGAAEGLFAWLSAAGQRLWMLLPLLPTTAGDPSPYATSSASGLNPLFIHLDWLQEYQNAGGPRLLSARQAQALLEARAAPRIRYELVL